MSCMCLNKQFSNINSFPSMLRYQPSFVRNLMKAVLVVSSKLIYPTLDFIFSAKPSMYNFRVGTDMCGGKLDNLTVLEISSSLCFFGMIASKKHSQKFLINCYI